MYGRTDALQQKTTLFDHLVGASEQLRREVEAERSGGLHIDHELVFVWRLHRQVGRLLTLEDAIDVTGRLPKLVGNIRPIAEQISPPPMTIGREE
jgi:hypothetical protein